MMNPAHNVTCPRNIGLVALIIACLFLILPNTARAESAPCLDCTAAFVAYSGTYKVHTLIDWSELDSSATEATLHCWTDTADFSQTADRESSPTWVAVDKPNPTTPIGCELVPDVGDPKPLPIVTF